MNAILSTVLTLLPDLLTAIAQATRSSALLPTLEPILTTASALVQAGEAGSAELAALTSHVKQMVAAGTDPTEDDWAQLQARSDAAHALIQGSS